jgi:phosphoribosylformylglycinamidine synthase I
MSVSTLVLSGFGINCEHETAAAFRRVGAAADIVHLNDLVADPAQFDRYQILAIPGGFSFGDNVASGKILANRLRHTLGEPMRAFVQSGKLAIGICNGFQVMVKMGLLPLFGDDFQQDVTLTHNNSDRYEDRWVTLAADPAATCVWTQGISTLEVPVRHGEGKFVPRDAATLDRLRAQGQVVFRYATAEGQPAGGVYPANPNGAIDDIAGICDPSGRIFGLMPHPEAYVDRTNHPRWTREELPEEGAGLQLFRNAVAYAAANLT